MRAKPVSLRGGHGRMNAEFTRLITARRHDTPLCRTADDDRLANERRVEFALHRHEERVEIDVHNNPFGIHKTKVKNYLEIANIVSNLALLKISGS